MQLIGLLLLAPLQHGPGDFPVLENADIPGAPKLGMPALVFGAEAPVAAGLHGLAAPAVFDWDRDGLKDLLVGEFETGACGVRVYRNVGTNEAPRFADEWTYALSGFGDRLEIDSW